MVDIDGDASAIVAKERDKSEATFQKHVIELAEMYGWKWHHETDSRRSKAGFPDLVLWHVLEDRMIFAELKRDKGYLSKKQKDVMSDLECISLVESYVWRPRDWPIIVLRLKTFN